MKNKEALSINKPRVSVILPVHGVEKYVEKCINSIQKQSLREIEIIPVNDASPDRSQKIIDRLAAADHRIKPLRLQENVGQGFARNEGLKVAKGDYIWFIDSDDWLVDPNFLAEIVAAAEENGADMTRAKKAGEAIFDDSDNLVKVKSDRTEEYFQEYVAKTDFKSNLNILHSRHFCLWLYRRIFIERNDIFFTTAQWEERAFLLKALLRAKIITLTTSTCFMYRIRKNSTARRGKNALDVERYLQNFEEVCTLLKVEGADERGSILREHLRFQLSHFIHWLFFGFWYQQLTKCVDSPREYMERVASSLDSLDFLGADFTESPLPVNRKLLLSGAYGLIVSALRARKFDFVDIAVNRCAISQGQLYYEFLTEPKSNSERDFQKFLNQYARNDKVKRQSPQESSDFQPRPRVIIHIGATKTGSTTIQHMLDKNRPALLRGGVWVPEVGLFWQPTRPHKQAGHSKFTKAAVQNDPNLREHIRNGLALMQGRIHTVILSSEAYFLQESACQLVDYLSEYEIKVLVYLRRQDEWANSQYCEFVAGGAIGRLNLSIGDWISQPNTRRRLNYLATLKSWAEKVGRENIQVRIYSDNSLYGGDIISDFAKSIDIQGLVDLPRPERKQRNDSRLIGGHIEIIRLYNKLEFRGRDDYFDFIEDVGEMLCNWRSERGLPQPKPWMLTLEQAESLMSDYSVTNMEIARDYLSHEDTSLFEARNVVPKQAPVFVEEITLIERVYQRYASPSRRGRKAKLGPKDKSRTTHSKPKREKMIVKRSRIVNYGLFGWRFWFLTPIVAVFYARLSTPKRLHEFLSEPAEFSSQHWAFRRPRLCALLYPQGNVMGPAGIFGMWIPVGRRLFCGRHGSDMLNSFEIDPIMFVRSMRGRTRRIVGRLMFPLGELR
ncbi:glycosyltransferase family 2 protein [Roseivivax halodurans]|uniref:glycosyltransferase family 2 protein n=1 Tax=Roseivivax halodurans TaxID=93683 RepID=UPI0004B4AC0B|nr:glycosyltransferase family 2 protein [Roseivivax halodurans]